MNLSNKIKLVGTNRIRQNDTRLRNREVIIFEPHGSLAEDKNLFLAEKLIRSKDRINMMLKNSILQIDKETDLILPSIVVNMRPVNFDGANLQENLTDVHELNQVRCVYSITEMSEDGDGDFLKNNGISHLVLIDKESEPHGWKSSKGLPSAKLVLKNLDKSILENVIHDILLDISMFYSWQYLYEELSKITDRINFSELKIKYASEKLSKNYYGVTDPEAQYLSFASYAREEKGLNYKLYNDIWEDFLKAEILKNSSWNNFNKRMQDPVDYIKKYHKNSGQLSRKTISDLLNNKKPGKYLLITSNERPKLIENREKIAKIFGKEKWRQNMIKVVEYSKLSFFLRYFPYITYFRFRK
ncbi:hypothetical protein [Gracilimonas sp. BCB1]|uniref:hypothetical protein n=1 Tax=Gracilimonas sp. BCB1 TaxID=3152362 RepID=UPI0032D8EBD4